MVRPHAEPEDIENSSRMAGEVLRWHVWPTLRQQQVGLHQWNCLRIYFEIWGPPEPDVFTWILIHDSPEIKTGDVPFGGKKYMTPTQRQALTDMEYGVACDQYPTRTDEIHAAHNISEELRRRAKICDLIDMLEFARVEQAMGNTLADGIVFRIRYALQQQIARLTKDERTPVAQYLIRTGPTI